VTYHVSTTISKRRLGWINAIGPPNHRVLVGTNMKVENESNIQPGPIYATYTEQVMWRDAATGKLLAASDFFSPMSSGSQVMPGYGGLSYHVLIDGHIMALKVLPQTNMTSSSTASTTTNTTNTTTGANSPPPSNSTSTNSTSTSSGG
jgi:hypothetical protein